VVPSKIKPSSRAAKLPLKISFILPALNEATLIKEQLQRLQGYRQSGHEVLLVDGGSSDNTVVNATGLADRIEVWQAGRSAQMNRGAELAQGELLLFLHVDTTLPEQADRLIAAAINSALDSSSNSARNSSHGQWGWFDVRLSNPGFLYRIIAAAMNIRARSSSVCTGDQAMFVSARLFHELGAFPAIPLMEDVAMSKLLRRSAKPVPIRAVALTSSRRWEQHGLVRTVVLMWWLRLQYFLGVSPSTLVKRYYPTRSRVAP